MSTGTPHIKRGRYKGMESIEITGAFDASDSMIEEYARQVLEEGGNSIVFDLRKTSYLTSPGIAVLIKAIKWCNAINGTVFISGATPDIQEFLALARVDRYLTFL
ncbi:MAG: STAS domain-containing protein [Chitinispirillaceae bacterium]|nr:STAS domain-containing protein [Chitinispirillaceae bacterium]